MSQIMSQKSYKFWLRFDQYNIYNKKLEREHFNFLLLFCLFMLSPLSKF